MKKKITAIFLCIALAATAIVGASLAYFTDDDSATNTFTVGNVQIDLQEGTKASDNEDNKVNLTNWTTKELMPGSQTVNNVSKIITVKNTGANAAWVWVDLKIPYALVDEPFRVVDEPSGTKTPETDTYNSLHINEYGAFCWNSDGTEAVKKESYLASAKADGIIIDDNGSTVEGMVENKNANRWNGFKVIEVVTPEQDTENHTGYVVLRSCMMSTLPAGKTSLPCLRQVYMDWRVTGEWKNVVDANGKTVTDENGNVKQEYVYTLTDGKTTYDGSWEIIATAYAIQDAGFETVNNAIAAYNVNGSRDTTENPQPGA